MEKQNKKDLQLEKTKDLKRRFLRQEIIKQLDNSMYAFMYAVESEAPDFLKDIDMFKDAKKEDLALKVDKSAEEFLIDLIFTDDTIERCRADIEANEKTPMDLINSTRTIAKLAIQFAIEEQAIVSKVHVQRAIESTPPEKIWPFGKLLLQEK